VSRPCAPVAVAMSERATGEGGADAAHVASADPRPDEDREQPDDGQRELTRADVGQPWVPLVGTWT